MITCNSCGKPNPADRADCQFCGAALAGQSGGRRGASAQEQIPAWLESLKASERPAHPAGGPPGFSMADLVDQDALPGWMRPDSAELSGNFDSSKHPAARPAWMSGPNTDSGSVGRISPGSLSAGSLIDSNSLPSWMQPAQTVQPDSISAGSLLEPDILPGWLTGQPSMPPQPSPHSQQSHQQASQASWSSAQAFQPGAFPASTSPTWADAPNPAIWQGPVNQVNPVQGGTDQPGSGIAGSSLLDADSLPNWIRDDSQAGQQEQQGQYVQDAGASGAGSLLSAGSLIDINSLPEWLRTAEQGTQGAYAPPISSSAFGGSGVYGTPGGQGAPPRVEGMRVPSRPRPEMAPLEQSEMAANVFSSMLGVASVSPSYPSTSMSRYTPAQQSFQAHGQVPSPAVPPFIQQGEQGLPPGAAPSQPLAPPSGYTAIPPTASAQGNMPNSFGAYQPSGQQAGYPAGAANRPVPISPGISQGQAAGAQAQVARPTGEKTARRGFLETIRGWFHL